MTSPSLITRVEAKACTIRRVLVQRGKGRREKARLDAYAAAAQPLLRQNLCKKIKAAEDLRSCGGPVDMVTDIDNPGSASCEILLDLGNDHRHIPELRY